MPPHKDDVIFYQASDEASQTDDHDSSTLHSSSTSGVSTSSSSSLRRRGILPTKDKVPFLKLRRVSQHDGVLDRVLEKGEDRKTGLIKTLADLKTRVQLLLTELEQEEKPSLPSPLRDACRLSLTTRMPLVLKQCQILVDRIQFSHSSNTSTTNNSNNSSCVSDKSELELIATLRSSFALVAAVQYLDTVQEALIKSEEGDLLDARLQQVLDVAAAAAGGQPYTFPAFRVSHWVAPSLAFDLSCGPKIHTSLPLLPERHQLPLNLEVEPVVTFKADDLLRDDGDDAVSFCGCVVNVLECRHRPHDFSEGSGILGVAFVRIRVSPIQQQEEELEQDETKSLPKKKAAYRIWGEKELEQLVVKEVRAVQLNAFPPKPRASVDLYTTSMYGDSGVAVTLVIKTCVTENAQEAPHLHVELFVAAP